MLRQILQCRWSSRTSSLRDCTLRTWIDRMRSVGESTKTEYANLIGSPVETSRLTLQAYSRVAGGPGYVRPGTRATSRPYLHTRRPSRSARLLSSHSPCARAIASGPNAGAADPLPLSRRVGSRPRLARSLASRPARPLFSPRRQRPRPGMTAIATPAAAAAPATTQAGDPLDQPCRTRVQVGLHFPKVGSHLAEVSLPLGPHHLDVGSQRVNVGFGRERRESCPVAQAARNLGPPRG